MCIRDSPEPFQPIVLVLDDYAHLRQRWADLAPAGEHEADVAENLLLGIHRLGRSVGIHLSVSCHGIAHHLGQSLAADLGATVVYTSLWRTVPLEELSHAG